MSDFNHLINTQTFTDFKQFFTAKNLENQEPHPNQIDMDGVCVENNQR